MASVTTRIYYYAYRGTTGLTDAKITIWDPAASEVVSASTMTELASGLYYYDFSTSTSGKHIAQMDSATKPSLENFEFTVTTTNTTAATVTSLHYCTSDDAFRASGLTTSEITTNNMLLFIREAEREVDRYANNTYWSEQDDGTATSAGTSTFTDSTKSWVSDEYIGDLVWIYKGIGVGQVRKIDDNDGTNLTIATAWTTTPDSSSKYRLIHTATDPYEEMLEDGDDTDTLFLDKYPVHAFDFIASYGITIQTSNIYHYKDRGKLVLKNTAEKAYWDSRPQAVHIQYYYGVYPLPWNIRRLTAIIAALKALIHQIGGTFDDVTSYSIPDFTASKGEPYTNIRETVLKLTLEMKTIKSEMVRYRSIF